MLIHVLLLVILFAQKKGMIIKNDILERTGENRPFDWTQGTQQNDPKYPVLSPTMHQLQFKETTLKQIKNETNSKTLSILDRSRIVETMKVAFMSLNPNLPLQRNLLSPKLDIIKKIQAFDANKWLRNKSEPFVFHSAIARIFRSTNDVHSVYVPPSPLNISYAVLGFYIEPYWINKNKRGYVFQSVWDPFPLIDQYFVKGVDILKVDGVDIDVAVNNIGRQTYAKRNGEDRVRYGVFYLTFRIVTVIDLPKKHTITFTYRDLKQKIRTISIKWRYLKQVNTELMMEQETRIESSGFDQGKRCFPSISRQSLKPYIDPFRYKYLHEMKFNRFGLSSTSSVSISPVSRQQTTFTINRIPIPISENFQNYLVSLKFEISDANSTFSIGYINLASFGMPIPSLSIPFINEIKRILLLLPKKYLLFDISGNTGGFPGNVYLMYTLLHGKPKEKYPITVRPSPIVGWYFRDNPIVQQYVQTGDSLTASFDDILIDTNITSLPNLKRLFYGKVLTYTSSLTLSGGDLYAALCKDAGINQTTGVPNIPLIGIDEATNGAGASSVSMEDAAEIAKDSGMISPLVNLTGLGIRMQTAFSRFHRPAGQLIEYFGITVDFWYRETKRDVLQDSADFLLFATEYFRLI